MITRAADEELLRAKATISQAGTDFQLSLTKKAGSCSADGRNCHRTSFSSEAIGGSSWRSDLFLFCFLQSLKSHGFRLETHVQRISHVAAGFMLAALSRF
jgi:hypothetical protein